MYALPILSDRCVPVGLEQVLAADRKFWTLLAEATDGEVKRNEEGLRPVDVAFSRVFESHSFYMMLAPRQGSFSASSRPAHSAVAKQQPTRERQPETDNSSSRRNKRSKKTQEQVQAAAAQRLAPRCCAEAGSPRGERGVRFR